MRFLNIHKKSNQSDEELLYSYLSDKNKNTLGMLFQRYIEMIYGLSLKYLKDENQAKDMVMEIYYHVEKKVEIHSIKNFKSWLFSLSRNKCLEYLRKEKAIKDKTKIAESVYSDTIMHHNYDPNKETNLALLGKCLESLVEAQEKCVRMFYLKSMSYKEIANLLNLSWSTIRSNIQNGRRNLTKCMTKENESE